MAKRRRRGIPPTHDSRYHRLFSDPAIVADLLRTFIPGQWLHDLNLDQMTRSSTKFHAGAGQRRDGDMVWRIPRRDGENTFLLLMLEFQSRPDRYMALRLLTYAGLLWQHLETEGQLASSGDLPPLLPVVIYNGQARWSAPTTLQIGLPADSRIWKFQPRMRYHLIETGMLDPEDLQYLPGAPALWFRLENAKGPADAIEVINEVVALVKNHPHLSGVYQAFVDLLSAIMTAHEPGLQIPNDLMEIRSMLETRAEHWKDDWKREGIQEGLRKGRQEGQASTLLRLLQGRFGELPAWASERVAAADSATLDQWTLSILDAAKLEDVVGTEPI
jgi:hypothetical protein